ncbi:hypothetical protein HPC49_10730 [Pyxidicoccus fallax]|uniref:Uncharacterized protein n=1 Tax=Pyxidicoccus fallax TaxID=394095 RepID=A0A848LFZ7_9BACT|nr:hypothetical protein [Pyxidicoccus fallax]NMO16143.1 hypothetical protein [Pyxidicoccus fallax]NPC78716.1 hypothetical protein [Pyxidicoccus fallax]
MGNDQRAGPIEALRNLTLKLERLAVREAMSGAVSGAAEGVRKEVPELDGQIRALAQDALTVLARLVHDAAEREQAGAGATAHTLAAAAMQGALEVVERQWRSGGMPLLGFIARVNHLFDEVVEFARSRTDEIRSPGDRAGAMAQGVVKVTVEELQEAVPRLAESARCLAPLGQEMAAKVGRGFVEGVETKLREESDALVGLLEHAGRGLVRGLAAGIREELASTPAASAEALGASLEKLAERSAAATVRGAGGELEGQGRRWHEALRNLGVLRRASREVTGGAMEALGTVLRWPVMAAVGAGSALMALSLLTLRRRMA